MKRIGIRDLRQQASKYLRDVERGETIEVTDRGRPVARLVPIGSGEGTIEGLIAAGRMIRGNGNLLAHRPLPAKPGIPLPSVTLARMREHER